MNIEDMNKLNIVSIQNLFKKSKISKPKRWKDSLKLLSDLLQDFDSK